MAKPNKKGKGPRRSQEGRAFDDSALDQLTSKIDQNLSSKDHKRKKPPTSATENQHQKRQRNSEKSFSEKNSKDDNEALMEEIRALGGDERDLELIMEVDSDDEDYTKDSKKPVEKSLKDEIAAFSKQLGLAEVEPSEASDEEEDAEEEAEDSEEEEESDGESDGLPRKVGDQVGLLVSYRILAANPVE